MSAASATPGPSEESGAGTHTAPDPTTTDPRTNQQPTAGTRTAPDPTTTDPRTNQQPTAGPHPAPDPTAVVHEHLRAFNAGDLQALLDGFTPDAVWVTGRSRVRGRTELAGFFGRAMADLGPTLTLRTLVATGGLVACELTEVLVSGGRRRTYPIACFYEIAAGRIASARIYREGSAEVT